MIIGVDASRANKPHKTGTEWYSYYLIRHFSELDRENEYRLYIGKPPESGLFNISENFKTKILNWPPQKLWTQIRLSYEMLVRAPDLLFIPAHVVPLIHPQKVVTTIHDIAFERFPRAYSVVGKIYLRYSTKFALRHSFKIITPSEFTKKELVGLYGASPEKIVVVSNGYNSDHYKIISDRGVMDKVLAKYNIKSPFIMTLGRIEEKKNTRKLLEAFHLLIKETKNKDLKLVLAGTKGFGYKKIEETIQKLKLKDRIIKLGWVREEDIPLLLNQAKVFIFPSLYEGFGIPLLEAMACGVPIITSNRTACPEVVGEAALLVNPEKPQEIVEAMKRVLLDPELSQNLVNNGLERVKKFSWQKCAEETFATLKRVI